jgi:hypothetical protein
MDINKNLRLLTDNYKSLEEFLVKIDKSNETNDLKTLIVYCNQRIDLFQELYNLEKKLKVKFEEELKKQANTRIAEQIKQLSDNDNNKTTPEEKTRYIEEYFKQFSAQLSNKEQIFIYHNRNAVIYYKLSSLVTGDDEYYLIYNMDDNKLYWGNTKSNKFSHSTIQPQLVSSLLTDKIDKPKLNELLDNLYFEILSSQQDTTSASNTNQSAQPVSIEQPFISQDVANNLSLFERAKKTLANGLRSMADSREAQLPPTTGGSKKTTYRLNGEKVVLLYKNKKVQRSIYVKGNGKTKYCKINKEYVLLSKVKNKIQ